jgi:hypothetical protein
VFGLVAVVAFVFVATCVPETKGKTLEEIEELLGAKPTEPSLRDPLLHNLYDGVGA